MLFVVSLRKVIAGLDRTVLLYLLECLSFFPVLGSFVVFYACVFIVRIKILLLLLLLLLLEHNSPPNSVCFRSSRLQRHCRNLTGIFDVSLRRRAFEGPPPMTPVTPCSTPPPYLEGAAAHHRLVGVERRPRLLVEHRLDELLEGRDAGSATDHLDRVQVSQLQV